MDQTAVRMKILLLGSHGQVGKELERQLSGLDEVFAFPRPALDITDHQAVRETVGRIHPDLIVNAAAYTAVDLAETNPDYAHAVNAEGVANLANIALTESAWLIHFSTDYVFDGTKKRPYLETDSTNPINIYGASKLAGEHAILASNCDHLTFRTSWVIGKDGHNFAKTILRLASEQDSIKVINDQIGVPTTPSLIAKVTTDAIRAFKVEKKWPKGIYHLSPQGASSWYEIAQTLLTFAESQQVLLKAGADDILATTTADFPTQAKRPMNSLLDTKKLRSNLSFDLKHWRDDFLAMASDLIEG